MNASDLKMWIDALSQDIDFVYLGVRGSICPFSRTDISVAYADKERTFQSVEAVMNEPFIGGKALKDICTDFTFE